ncbi:hypothetical protein H6F67_18525 [Microcoleus sp. FACHB-1515]|uniref:hypothetical protein n=1 Tax=Cyanophyceae TaxID=3028117 RepID=UPI0016838C04|nr:hypothetical protein [Microcoleus sp. FACHB-1515]MBD2091842.1 hypothetical protein [Microcoleus sp. FACHB-1515]
MALSRIILDPDIRHIVDAVQAKTRSPSPSAAIALLVSRYGKHLIETWELDPNQYRDPHLVTTAAASPTLPATPQPAPAIEFQFTEAIDL